MVDTTRELLPLEHQPAHPARAGTPSEGIYLNAWQTFIKRAAELAEASPYDDGDEFLAIFRHSGRELTQPMATAAASFITWLGTNCGQAFLFEAQRRAREAPRGWGEATAWLAQWAIENERLRHINHGLRCIEFLLAEKHPIVEGTLGVHVGWDRVPEVTMEQHDAIECVVRWLSCSQGATFIASCEAQIKAARNDEQLFGAPERTHA